MTTDAARFEPDVEGMKAWRHAIHRHPELGFEEQATSALVAERLRAWGYEVHTGIAVTGVVGVLRVGDVPLFSGFMYACVGSYIARIWRLFDVAFVNYPPIWTTWLLAILAYANFFTHHYTIDIRHALFAFSVLIFWRTWFVFTPDQKPRRMPMLVGALLVSLFIWFAENLGTFAAAWVYPSQRDGWHMVSLEKMGSWYLLMLLSFVLVTLVHKPSAAAALQTGEAPAPHPAGRVEQ